jgi:hypothetical protein
LGFKGEQNKNESPSFRHNFIASSSPPPAVPWLNVTYSFGSITNQEPNGSLQIKQKKTTDVFNGVPCISEAWPLGEADGPRTRAEPVEPQGQANEGFLTILLNQ